MAFGLRQTEVRNIHWKQGLRTKQSDDNVSATPTDAELDSAFGTPATVGSGFIGVLDDAGAGAAYYICISDGSNWWYTAMTKAL